MGTHRSRVRPIRRTLTLNEILLVPENGRFAYAEVPVGILSVVTGAGVGRVCRGTTSRVPKVSRRSREFRQSPSHALACFSASAPPSRPFALGRAICRRAGPLRPLSAALESPGTRGPGERSAQRVCSAAARGLCRTSRLHSHLPSCSLLSRASTGLGVCVHPGVTWDPAFRPIPRAPPSPPYSKSGLRGSV